MGRPRGRPRIEEPREQVCADIAQDVADDLTAHVKETDGMTKRLAVELGLRMYLASVGRER